MSEEKKHKKCFKCSEFKPLTAFYKNKGMRDGRVNKCKDCNKKDVSKNYRKNKKHYIEYEQKRNKLPHRVKARKDYYEKVRDTDAYKKSHYENSNNYKEKFPLKRAAHVAWGNYVRDFNVKSEPCARCQNLDTHAHHEDYNKPLDIVWLCRDCHGERHQEINYAIKVLGEDWSDRGF